jgi:imidazolonepropionase-like amidohydrolase
MLGAMVITNVAVVDAGRAVPAQDVTIREGRFEAVEPARHERAGDIDGTGRFLAPGLWESHTHIRSSLGADEQASLDGVLRAYVRRGITSVVDLGGPLEAFEVQRERQRREGAAGRARLQFAGPSFTGVGGWPLRLHHNHALVREVADAAAAESLLRGQLEHRPDVIKIIYDGEPGSPEKLPREALPVIVGGAHAAGLRVVVHVRTLQDCLDALEAGADGLEHSFLPSPGGERAEAEQLTEALLRERAYLTPTLAIWEQLGRAGDQRYVDEMVAKGCMAAEEAYSFLAREPDWGTREFPHHPKAECLERLEAARRFLPDMAAAGVKLAAGSDVALLLSRPGAALRELGLLAEAGIPLGHVLAAGSRHAAEKVGLGGSAGSIEPGRDADALLLDANPLDGIDALVRPEHLDSVIRAGEAVNLS